MRVRLEIEFDVDASAEANRNEDQVFVVLQAINKIVDNVDVLKIEDLPDFPFDKVQEQVVRGEMQ